MDDNLFGHINLDAELAGTYGVQGAPFRKTFTYLHDYIQTLSNDNPEITSNLKPFIEAMNQLVTREKAISECAPQQNAFQVIINQWFNELEKQPTDVPFLMPGGWVNAATPGHAMIYQLIKNEDGSLDFSIYNSGAGLDKHAKVSTLSSEQYFPVKTFHIPPPPEDKANYNASLKDLFSKIFLAQSPNHRSSGKNMDADKLYGDIEHCMAFLKAEERLPEDQRITTAGQISGTCAQRSIHQMLKANFGNLPGYQRFIFDFKMHALREYVEYTKGKRTKKNLQDIILAIENNIKILQEPGVFDTENEKKTIARELGQIKRQCQDELASFTAAFSDKPVEKDTKASLSTELKTPNEEIALPQDAAHLDHLKSFTLSPDHSLIEQLRASITQINDIIQTDPINAIAFIEDLMTQMPIPENEDAFNHCLPFYDETYKNEELDAVCEAIKTLHTLYDTALKNCRVETRSAKQTITEYSCLALYDYLGHQHALKHQVTSIHPIIYKALEPILECESAYFSTNNPKYDLQYVRLMRLYRSMKAPRRTTSQDHYMELLNSEPDARKALTIMYEKLEDNTSVYKKILNSDEATKALYYITKQLEEHAFIEDSPIRKEQRFEPLRLKIERAIHAERFIAQIKHQEQQDTLNFKLIRGFYAGAEQLVFNSPNDEKVKLDDKHLAQAKYPRLKDNIYQSALRSHQSSNSIQTTIAMDKRELFYLTRDPDYQIKLTIDHYLRDLDLLKDPVEQNYLEALLFDPTALLHEFSDNQSLSIKIHTLIEKGLLNFLDTQSYYTTPSLFFIRLSFLFEEYAQALDQSRTRKYQSELLSRLNQQLELPHLDLNIGVMLHQYRLLTLLQQYDYFIKEKGEEEVLTEAFISFFHLQIHPNQQQKDDPTFAFECYKAKRQFQDMIAQQPTERLISVIRHYLKTLTPSINPQKIEGKYPFFFFYDGDNNYHMNLQDGLLFKNNLTHAAVPFEIKNHPTLKKLHLENETTCFLSSNGSIVQFDKDSESIRLEMSSQKWKPRALQSYSDIEFIYKKSSIAGKHDWYQVILGMGYQIPEILKDSSSEAWIKCDGTTIYILQDGQPKYRAEVVTNYQWTTQTLYALDEDKQPSLESLLLNSTYHQRLGAFESPRFMRVHLNETTRNGHVYLDRYGISLVIDAEKIRLQGTTFEFVEKPMFAANVAQLTFQNDTKQEQCMVAIQRFCIKSSRDAPYIAGEYYPLEHDIDDAINGIVLRKMFHSNIERRYQNSERFITWPIINGAPKPHHASDALYLCYLYLATHEHQKAWDVLEDIRQRFTLTGSEDELTYLSWIINDLPNTSVENDTHAILSTPRDVACQLKALSLYTDFLAAGYLPKFGAILPKEKITLASQLIDNEKKETVQKFHKNFSSYIVKHYTQFLNLKPHLSSTYTLSDVESRSLLAYIEGPYGALGYEKLYLNLKRLIKELNTLNLLIDTSASVPSAIIKRRDAIQKHLDEQQTILKKSTRLELRPINMTCPKHRAISFSGPINDDRYNPLTASQLEDNIFPTGYIKKIGAIKALCSSITEKNFLLYLQDYFSIACEGKDSQNGKILYDFCIHYLIGHRFKSLEEEESNIPYLCHLLYRGLEHPEELNYIRRSPVSSLEDIRKKMETLSVTPIVIYQATDVFEEPLRETQALIEEIKAQTHEATPLQTQSARTLTVSFREACINLLSRDLFYDYVEAEENYQRELQALVDSSELEKENRAGQLKFECIQKQREIAFLLLQQASVRQRIKQEAEKFNIKPSWEKALLLANQTLQSRYAIDLLASTKRLLTEADLRKAYVQGNLVAYLQMTELSEEECRTLHDLIHHCITLEIQTQHADRILQSLEKLPDEPQGADFANLAQIIMSHLLPETHHDPALMLFQFEENIVLRPRQIEALHSLIDQPAGKFSFNQTVEKIIMGGGKSKVILPLLALKKATGFNLVIIEVPRSLIATNHADLNATSQRLFNQRAFRFEFDRNSDDSPARLKQIYEQFIEIMHTQSYLVTTGESMQSLELKYLELLLIRPEERQESWNEQIEYLSEITTLLKACGDAVIDEAHEGLLLKRKLNYSLGEPEPVTPALVELTIHLYQFIDQLDKPIDDQSLIEALLSLDSSPIHSIIKQLCTQYDEEETRTALRNYLNNKEEPQCFSALSLELKGKLAFHKEQIKLLPMTLNRRYKEHYGPSKLTHCPAEQRVLAIPYSANDKPNESSRFGQALETLNYTTQAMLQEGLNLDILKQTLLQWQQQAQRQYQENPSIGSIDKTLAGCIAKTYLPLLLSEIDLNNERQIKDLFERVRDHRGLIYHILKQHILKNITIEPTILHSDAYNHVSLYHTIQALTGTPTNHTTYDQRLSYNESTALGTDGYIQEIIKSHETPIRPCAFTGLLIDFFSKLQTQSSSKICSIIDINATLVGQSNLHVAQAMSQTFAQNREHEIQYILYFDEIEGDDVLCAWDIKRQKSVIIGTSDPAIIDQRLACGPNERLTYYDQAHITGTDLKQPQNGVALCLIDQNTQLQHFLQGAMRMRGLHEQQHIEIVTPENMQDLSLDTILIDMKEVEDKQLREDNFYAALGKMNNILREEALRAISELDDVVQKSELAIKLRTLLIREQSMNLFEMYGKIYTQQPTEELLEKHRDSLLRYWETCIENSGFPIAYDEKSLNQKMVEIITSSIPHCNKTNLSPTQNHQNTEIETQQECLKEQKQLVQTLIQTEERSLSPREEKPWTYNEWLELKKSGKMKLSLNEYTNTTLFSANLYVSENYQKTYRGQSKQLDSYIKPIHAILFTKINGQLFAHLITLEEVKQLGAWLPLSWADDSNACWISTTQHTVLEGSAPADIIESKAYQKLIEQIRFFNGKTEELITQNTPYFWLCEETRERLTYLHETLSLIRRTNPISIEVLKDTLKDYQARRYEEIESEPFKDFSNTQWHEKYPDAKTPEISALIQVSKAYHKANLLLQTKALSIEDFKDALIPELAIDNFKTHLERLNQIRETLKAITSDDVDSFFELLADHKVQTLLNPLVDLPFNQITIQDNTSQCLILAAFILSPWITEKEPFKAYLEHIAPKLDVTQICPPFTESRIYLRLTKPDLPPETLNELLDHIDHTHDDDLLLSILAQKDVDDQLLERILSRPHLNIHIVKAIANRATKYSLIRQLIQNYPQSYPEILNPMMGLKSVPQKLLINQMEDSTFYEFLDHIQVTHTLPEEFKGRTGLQRAMYQVTRSALPPLNDILLLLPHSLFNKKADLILSLGIERMYSNQEAFQSFSELIMRSNTTLGKEALRSLLKHLENDKLEVLMRQYTLTRDDLIVISARSNELTPAIIQSLYQYASTDLLLFRALLHSPNASLSEAIQKIALQQLQTLSVPQYHLLAQSDLSLNGYRQLVAERSELLTEISQREDVSAMELIALFDAESHTDSHTDILTKRLIEKRAQFHELLSNTFDNHELDLRISVFLEKLDAHTIDLLLDPFDDILELGRLTFNAICSNNGDKRSPNQIDLLIRLCIDNESGLRQIIWDNDHLDLTWSQVEIVFEKLKHVPLAVSRLANYPFPQIYLLLKENSLLNSTIITYILLQKNIDAKIIEDILNSEYCDLTVIFSILSLTPYPIEFEKVLLRRLNDKIKTENVINSLRDMKSNNLPSLQLLLRSDLEKTDDVLVNLLSKYASTPHAIEEIINIKCWDDIDDIIDVLDRLILKDRIAMTNQILNLSLSQNSLTKLLQKLEYRITDDMQETFIKFLKQPITDQMLSMLVCKYWNITITQEIMDLVEKKCTTLQAAIHIIKVKIPDLIEASFSEALLQKIIEQQPPFDETLFKIISKPIFSDEFVQFLRRHFYEKPFCTTDQFRAFLPLTRHHHAVLVLELLSNSDLSEEARQQCLQAALEYYFHDEEAVSIVLFLSDNPIQLLKNTFCSGYSTKQPSPLFITTINEDNLKELVNLLKTRERIPKEIALLLINQPQATDQIILDFIKISGVTITDELLDVLLSKTKHEDIYIEILENKLKYHPFSKALSLYSKIIDDPALGQEHIVLKKVKDLMEKHCGIGDDSSVNNLLSTINKKLNTLKTSNYREQVLGNYIDPSNPSNSPKKSR